jgi:hypothetical protein
LETRFYLKTWILPLKLYGPEKARLEKRGINGEDYQKKLDERLKASIPHRSLILLPLRHSRSTLIPIQSLAHINIQKQDY